jgi:hypothetical protein
VILDDAESDIDDAALWSTARKALFCIREIVGTEKKIPRSPQDAPDRTDNESATSAVVDISS